MTELPAIPYRDVREGGPVRHAIEAAEQARALRDDCLAWFPKGARHMVRVLDSITARWLMRSNSPYKFEVASIAAALQFPGVWFLNGSYEWGCTSLARDDDAPWLVRTLDWPFPGLGRHVEVARMRGPAGDFYNVTWPGFVGILTAMAPGRFSAAVNQAPLWRRTRHPWLRPYDMLANAIRTWSIRNIPPTQLLRQVFETCADFDSARRKLETTPIARPVIYTLAGAEPGECCVIERTENEHLTRFENTSAANDWLVCREFWEARIGGDQLFTAPPSEVGGNSKIRREALNAWSEPLGTARFAWVTPPVLNKYTRVATEMCAASGLLRVVGYEQNEGFDLPAQVTQAREIEAIEGGLEPHILEAALEYGATMNCKVIIHPGDHLVHYMITHSPRAIEQGFRAGIVEYFEGGRLDTEQLLRLMTSLGHSRASSVLEFASGYGRMTRHIDLPDFMVADIHEDAVDFLRGKMGVHAIQSATNPNDFDPGRTFDFIFALSLFSHLPDDAFGPWLHRLFSLLNPGGHLMFTTYGAGAADNPALGSSMPEDGSAAFHQQHTDQPDLEFLGLCDDGRHAALRQTKNRRIHARPDRLVHRKELVADTGRMGRGEAARVLTVSSHYRRAERSCRAAAARGAPRAC